MTARSTGKKSLRKRKVRHAQAEAPRAPIAWGPVLRQTGVVVLALVLAGGALWGVRWLRDPATLPIRQVRIEGHLHHLTVAQLLQAVAGTATGGFFGVNVDAVRRAAQALPWVDQASVRRVWPDTLAVLITEQQPLARWGDDALVNVRGQLFRPAAATIPKGLPELDGPQGLEAAVVQQYRTMSAVLAPIGLHIAQLVEDPRRAWQLKLENGVELRLGREETLSRLDRFVRVYPLVLAPDVARLKYVDMRYSNGFAARWAQRADTPAGKRQEG